MNHRTLIFVAAIVAVFSVVAVLFVTPGGAVILGALSGLLLAVFPGLGLFAPVIIYVLVGTGLLVWLFWMMRVARNIQTPQG